MTPARRETLTDAIDLIAATTREDAWATGTDALRAKLIELGAVFGETIVPTDDDDDLAFCLILEDVRALCAWDNGEHLITRWAANARNALAAE